MKMYESYETSGNHCNKNLEPDGPLISYFLPYEYCPGESNGRIIMTDYMREFRGAFEGVDSTANSKQLIFKTDPDESAEHWKEKEPKNWSNTDVLHWIASVAETHKFPYEFINANAFNVDGKTLLSFSKREFIDLDDQYGVILYMDLRKNWPRHLGAEDISTTTTTFRTDDAKTEVKHLETLSTPRFDSGGGGFTAFTGKGTRKGSPYGLVSGATSYGPEVTESPESYPFELQLSAEGRGGGFDGGEEDDEEEEEEEEGEEEVEREGAATGGGEEVGEVKGAGMMPKRPPGRPPGIKTKRDKPEKKTGRLWEFIRDLLLDPQHCPSVICWENHDDGVFRFVKSEKVAKIWGDRKGNEKMNYEKLSRAMRYYYRSKVLQPVLGRRLVYKFGPTARGWKTENPNFRH